LSAWVRAFAGSYASRRRRDRPLEQALADIEAVERIWREPDANRSTSPVAFVGKSGLVRVATVRDLAAQAIARGELSVTRPQLTYRYARRFPNGASDRTSAPDELAAIDCVDALVETTAHSTHPAVRALGRRAHSLIGHVLRVASLEEITPVGDAHTQALHVVVDVLAGIVDVE
jgi:hypothetical protein